MFLQIFIMFYSSAFFAITTLSCFVVPALSVQSLDYQATVRGSSSTPRTPVCRCFPGDSCWPSASAWQAFNASVYGRLVATVPLASPCHNSTFAAYNANTCKALQDQWLEPQIQYDALGRGKWQVVSEWVLIGASMQLRRFIIRDGAFLCKS